MCDPNKTAFEGIADQKIALSVLVIFWPPDPIQWVSYTLKLAPKALPCSQGMLETPWGVFLVGHAKSFDLSGVEAM